MHKTLFSLLIFSLLLSCSKDENKFTIKGKIISNSTLKTLILLKLKGKKADTLIQTQVKADGSFELAHSAQYRTYYTLASEAGKITVIVSPGEQLELKIQGDDFPNQYSTNSKECNDIQQFAQQLQKIKQAPEDQQVALYKELHAATKKKLMADPYALSNIFILNAKLNQYPIFDLQADEQLFKVVANAMHSMFPKEPYAGYLYKKVKQQFFLNKALEKQSKLEDYIAKNAKTLDFPELNLPNTQNKKKRLSSTKGKYTIVDFWSMRSQESGARLQKLKQIYSQFKGKKLEIYQVSLDREYNTWKQVVEMEKLPWVSVIDTASLNSKAIGLFNINTLPKTILLDPSGKKVLANDANLIDLHHQLRKLLK